MNTHEITVILDKNADRSYYISIPLGSRKLILGVFSKTPCSIDALFGIAFQMQSRKTHFSTPLLSVKSCYLYALKYHNRIRVGYYTRQQTLQKIG